MNRFGKCLLGMSLATAACGWLAAQEATEPQMSGPPKVLTIQREFIKPGKAGMIHDRSETNFVQAMSRAKWPTHYVALNSLSGKSRALYLLGYDSFADWQKDDQSMMKDSALAGEVDHFAQADGDLLDSSDQVVLYLQPDLSLNTNRKMAEARYIEVTSFRLHPGHHTDWTTLVKMVLDGHKKAGTNANWAMYELEYGGGDEYVLFSLDNGLSEIDQSFAEGKKFHDAMGDEGMKKLDELVRDCVVSIDSELFAINPRQSYPPANWVKADPDFWKVKPVLAATRPATEKPKSMPTAKHTGQ